MTAIVSGVTSLVNAAVGWIGQFAAEIGGATVTEGVLTINNVPLFIYCLCLPLVGLGVGLFKRLLSARG